MQIGPIKPALEAGAASRGSVSLLMRFWRDWLAPHRGEIAVSLVLMALLAATTGAYSEIVKLAFNALGAGRPAPGALGRSHRVLKYG